MTLQKQKGPELGGSDLTFSNSSCKKKKKKRAKLLLGWLWGKSDEQRTPLPGRLTWLGREASRSL